MKTTSIDIDWLAVILATIIYSAFCGIWHKQFAFGKKWEQAMGFVRPENWKESSIYYVVPLLACFVTTVAIAILLNLFSIYTLLDALFLGLFLGLGFASPIVFTVGTIPTMKKPLVFGAITGLAQAFGITLVTAILFILTKK
jgi:hypothetical protein